MSDSFMFVNDGPFRTSVLPQVLDFLQKHGKRNDSGRMNGQSLRAATLSHKVSLGGREYTILDIVCTKNNVNPALIDARSVDGIAGFAVDKVREYVSQSRPEWFPAPAAKSTRREVPEDVMEALGL